MTKRTKNPSVTELAERAEAAVVPETAKRWMEAGEKVLGAISEKVAIGEPIPQTWLAFARTFSEWHADYLTATAGDAPKPERKPPIPRKDDA